MFGALNRFLESLDPEPQAQASPKAAAFGFQILKNTNNALTLEPWFDFIVGINGRNIDNPDPSLFAAEVRNCAGTSVELGVWSAKGQKIRSMYAEVPSTTTSLGLSIQWTSLNAAEDVWHILDVAPNSPADLAGLLPYGDYIIGSPEALVKGESGMGEMVEDDQFIDQPLRLYVYNHEYNVTRLVTIEPSRSWGGVGALGCVLGFGALHRIPATLDEPVEGPGETLFETTRLSTEDGMTSAAMPDPAGPPRSQTSTPQYIVPAEMDLGSLKDASLKPAAATTAGGRKTKQRHHHHTPDANDMDAYFAEGEAKSRAADNAPSPKPGAAPPPPKGGPPKDTASKAEDEENAD